MTAAYGAHARRASWRTVLAWLVDSLIALLWGTEPGSHERHNRSTPVRAEFGADDQYAAELAAYRVELAAADRTMLTDSGVDLYPPISGHLETDADVAFRAGHTPERTI